jgi:hypothetical protein
MTGLREEYRKRLPMTVGVLLFIGGVGLWIQATIVIFDVSHMTAPVGDWSGLAWRVFFSGLFLICGTYLLTMHRGQLKSDLRNDPILGIMRKRKGV